MSEPTKADFERVRFYADTTLATIIEEAKANKINLGAVNYGDIGVTGIQWVADESGDTFWRIVIEECSPGCGIPKEMYERLPIDILPVEVSCEW